MQSLVLVVLVLALVVQSLVLVVLVLALVVLDLVLVVLVLALVVLDLALLVLVLTLLVPLRLKNTEKQVQEFQNHQLMKMKECSHNYHF